MITDKKVEKSIFRTRNLHCPISPVVHEIKNKTILFATIFFFLVDLKYAIFWVFY